mmetsp:Transcript_52069/g.96423  ORF Transcript_52069/g.96423 Transcript_52069/m.96423 type:complete len:172 (-) Transcript_52069:185-700(-)
MHSSGLKLPTDPDVLEQISKACALAESGDIKAAQQLLKQVVVAGHITSVTQRQVVAAWSDGVYDLTGKREDTKSSTQSKKKESTFESQVTQVMKERGFSHKAAVEFIEGGGLEMEKMQMEMDHPMDEAFQKIKEQGPPQWFIDAFREAEEKRQAAEGAEQIAPAAPQVEGA